MSGSRRWSLAGTALAVVSLGLSWGGEVSGTAHPARVAVVAVLVLVVAAERTGRVGLLTAALPVGVVGLLLGGVDASPGRLVLAGALVCVALAARSDGRRLLPSGAVRRPAG